MEQLHLARQIRAFRKERGLTQEQLAQALGVTAGAVYKWEAELSSPDLSLLVALADFFDTSVDVLLGYAPRDNRQETVAARLREYHRRKDPAGLQEAERALKKYPNAFPVVYAAARLTFGFGMEQHDRRLLERARELYESLLHLMNQNRDPKVGETTIWGSLAQIELLLGQKNRAMEILKTHNVNGIFNADIGFALAADCERPDEAEPFLSEAMIDLARSLVQVIFGWLNVYLKTDANDEAETLLFWGLRQMKEFSREGEVSFLEKIEVSLKVVLAYLAYRREDLEQARSRLEAARETALHFDAAPSYSADRLRYVSMQVPASAFDDLGVTAMASAERLLRGELAEAPELLEIWKEVCGNGENGSTAS